MIAPGFAVRAALALSASLTLLGLVHIYWALDGTWGFAAALGRQEIDVTTGLRLGAGAVAIALLVAAAGVLGRVGIWGGFLPWVLFSWATWTLAAALFLAAVVNLAARTRREQLVFAPIALVLGILALLVARSPRP